jgi:putative transposase
VHRQFTVAELDRLWLTDITEHPTAEGKVYCAAVMDACSRRIIGWSIDASQKTELVVDAIGMAILRRRPSVNSTILHSDHGTQGGFNRSSQHLDSGGADGQAGWVDDGSDGAVADEVAGRAGAPAGGRARVLA